MFILTKGFCTVTVTDERKVDIPNFKILRPGDHFGEISLLYGCPRTATVVSQNYITIAKLKYDGFNDIRNSYPQIVDKMKEHLYNYNDRLKKFLIESLEKIEFFKGIGNAALHDIIYTLERHNYNKDYVLQKIGDDANTLMIL